MEEQFELILTNRTPGDWLIILGAVLLIVAAAYAGTILIHSEGLQLWWCIVTTFGIAYGAFRLLKQRMMYQAIISVEADRLMVLNIINETVITILFAEVASYRYMVVKDVHWLIFKMIDGSKLKISANANFGEIESFDGLMEALEHSAAKFRLQNTAVMLQNKSFF
ncbi:hypothetical protein [Hymenobacter coccineus]|uniref:YcxB-like protein domain-containing protein n=1 Tax=Hymenobacter coccineus TaxID=1908235 RepID=A0A1G1TE24_9BACT|nr:hypothetical protein [Hymenobacter coccineus]OGX89127.1 hypothetical protein BEN49_09675 [Hymenobacter coccineus]